MNIAEISEVSDEILIGLGRLVTPFRRDLSRLSKDELNQIISAPGTLVFIARDPDSQNEIIGTLSLVFYQAPSGLYARIIDLVVEDTNRAGEVDEALIRTALQRAEARAVISLDLTSHVSRVASNQLYERLGFKKRDANSYRYNFTLGGLP